MIYWTASPVFDGGSAARAHTRNHVVMLRFGPTPPVSTAIVSHPSSTSGREVVATGLGRCARDATAGATANSEPSGLAEDRNEADDPLVETLEVVGLGQAEWPQDLPWIASPMRRKINRPDLLA